MKKAARKGKKAGKSRKADIKMKQSRTKGVKAGQWENECMLK